MNIPQGYKQTELGIIPEDWNIKSIGEFLSIGNGHDYKGKSFGNIPVYGTGGIITHIDDYLYDGQTICIGRKGTIDKPIFHSGKIWTVDTLYYTYNFIDIEVKFIYYLLLTIDWMSLNEATGVPSLTSDRIKQITLALPPIAEQRAIAEALSDVDGLIAALDKKIAKKRLLKQGAMQQLLTGKKRLHGFTDKWVEKSFADIFIHISTRNHQIDSSLYQSVGKYPIVDQGQIPIVGYTDDVEPIVCEQDGTIIFGDHTRIFKYVNYNFCVGADGTQVLFCKNNMCTKFIYYLCCIMEIPNTGYNRHYKYVKDKHYTIPSNIKEQQAIATILSDMDKEIADLEAQRDKYHLLKSGMMQKLLTGQIRLKTE